MSRGVAASGASDADIKVLGGWKSNCFNIYVAPTDSHFARLQSVLANATL